MTFQNRVTPFGNIIADNARGLFTGNRGIIHDPDTKHLLKRRWASKAWIICVCEFKGRRRDVFGRNGKNGGAGWTELFFLDEATAFAAGHRPCFTCQREKAVAFQEAFSKGQGVKKLPAPQIDILLHTERLNKRQKRRHLLNQDWKLLPNGTFIGCENDAFMVYERAILRWTPQGYKQTAAHPQYLITPPSTLAALKSAYLPVLHDSALSR